MTFVNDWELKINLPVYPVLNRTPMPKFKTPEEAQRAEKLAAEHARSIETQDGYMARMDKENSTEVDEETKFSSVIRPNEAEASSSAGR